MLLLLMILKLKSIILKGFFDFKFDNYILKSIYFFVRTFNFSGNCAFNKNETNRCN